MLIVDVSVRATAQLSACQIFACVVSMCEASFRLCFWPHSACEGMLCPGPHPPLEASDGSLSPPPSPRCFPVWHPQSGADGLIRATTTVSSAYSNTRDTQTQQR